MDGTSQPYFICFNEIKGNRVNDATKGVAKFMGLKGSQINIVLRFRHNGGNRVGRASPWQDSIGLEMLSDPARHTTPDLRPNVQVVKRAELPSIFPA